MAKMQCVQVRTPGQLDARNWRLELLMLSVWRRLEEDEWQTPRP